jgi:hypothetical protein
MKTRGFGEFTLFGDTEVDGGEVELQERVSDSGIAKAFLTLVGNDGKELIVNVRTLDINLEDWEEIKGKAAK